jgi:hypothetical protein
LSQLVSIVKKILGGLSDANIGFDDLVYVLEHYGFDRRTKGSHNIFRKAGIYERINLQKDGNKAKPYQVKQVRKILVDNQLVKYDA